jgi:hypothetical protein
MAAKLQVTVPSFGIDETGNVYRIYRKISGEGTVPEAWEFCI